MESEPHVTSNEEIRLVNDDYGGDGSLPHKFAEK
jgi:hypothetical protein